MRNPGRFFFLLILLIAALGAAFTGAALYFRLLYLAAGLLGLSWLWTWLSLRGLRLRRQAHSLRASVGDIFEETFEIENHTLLPRLWLEVQNLSPLPQAAGSRLLTWLGGKQKRTYLARTWLTRRGAYALGPTRLSSGDPFGLFSVSRSLPAADSLLVLPLLLPLTHFPAPQGLLPGGSAARRKTEDITPQAAGVREYAPGDPLKRIHWPSSARRGKWMVKEFDQDPQAEMWLFLDAQARWHAERPAETPYIWRDWMLTCRPEISLPPASLEYAVTLTASLAHLFQRQRRPVGLTTEAPAFTVLRAERGERQEQKMLETLAFVRPEGRLPLISLVQAQVAQLPPGSCCLLVTPSGDESLLLTAEMLLQRGLSVYILHLMAHTFGGPRGGQEMHQKILARGLPSLAISQGDDLTAALNQFFSIPFL